MAADGLHRSRLRGFFLLRRPAAGGQAQRQAQHQCTHPLQFLPVPLQQGKHFRIPLSPQVVADLAAAAEEMRWLSPWWFLPPFLISLVPLAFAGEVW